MSNNDSESINKNMWIRPLTDFDKMMEDYHQLGVMLTCCALTLNSKKPLEEDQVKKALGHLFRKAPNLRVCLRFKEKDQLWFHEMEKENIDFKVSKNVSFHEEYQSILKYKYNISEGPLWCTRLLPVPPNTPSHMAIIQENYPNQYYLLCGFHHVITDGASAAVICDSFLQLLNDVISENPINDENQVGEFTSADETEVIMSQVASELKSNPLEIKKLQKLLDGEFEENQFMKAFPPPKNMPLETLNIAHSLTESETEKFAKRCKREGVTIHSGFSTVIDAAIIEMLMNSGASDEKFTIKSYHVLNARRYWHNKLKNTSLGNHISRVFTANKYCKDIFDNFWEYARSFYYDFQNSIDYKSCFKQNAAMQSLFPPDNDTKEHLKTSRISTLYGITNMGNLNKTFSGEGEHVQVTNVQATTSTINNLCSHVLFTFRGRFIYGIDYNQDLMSEATAKKYVDTIFNILQMVS